MSESEFIIGPDLDGERLDVGLARLKGMSRSQAANLISDGAVLVGGKQGKRSDSLKLGASVTILAFTDSATSSESNSNSVKVDIVPINIVYEDSDVVVVDKPVGVAAHPSHGWTGQTVTETLAESGVRLAGIGAAEREGIVHRLDVGTSGLMVLAKSENAYTSLKDQFRSREVEKTYHALVQGHPDPSEGTVDAPIGRNSGHDYRFAVVNGGKPSITHYSTLEAFPYASLLEIGLETGRTHQIRVHMSALRHPCCGDITYGADPVLSKRLGLSRQWLHAVELGFTHPASGEKVSFISSYPADLVAAIEYLRD